MLSVQKINQNDKLWNQYSRDLFIQKILHTVYRIMQFYLEFLICRRHSRSSGHEQKIELFLPEGNQVMQIISSGWSDESIGIMNEKSIGLSELLI